MGGTEGDRDRKVDSPETACPVVTCPLNHSKSHCAAMSPKWTNGPLGGAQISDTYLCGWAAYLILNKLTEKELSITTLRKHLLERLQF